MVCEAVLVANCFVCGQPVAYVGDEAYVHLTWEEDTQDVAADADHAAYIDTPDYDDYLGKHDS